MGLYLVSMIVCCEGGVQRAVRGVVEVLLGGWPKSLL